MESNIAIDLADYQAQEKAVVTIGSFDGIHLGHQKILAQVVKKARHLGHKALLMTFWPHPRLVVEGYDKNFKLLDTPEEKAATLSTLGIDQLVVAPFTRDFSEQSPEQYIENVLIRQLMVSSVIVGHDHRFGKDRKGDYDMLSRFGLVHGFEVERLSQLEENSIAVSSTKIREALREGQVDQAARLLGRPYSVNGLVVKGEGRGRKIGYPTANISVMEDYKLTPKMGVYVVLVKLKNHLLKGMLNIGNKPTFHTMPQEKSIEVHLFDFSENLYGQRLTLFFLARLRDEVAFGGSDELILQLEKDKKAALSFLASQ